MHLFQYWASTGPLPYTVLGQCWQPALAQYRSANRFGNGPVLASLYWANTGPILAQYRAITCIPFLGQDWANAGNTVLGQNWASIGPQWIQYWANAGIPIMTQYWHIFWKGQWLYSRVGRKWLTHRSWYIFTAPRPPPTQVEIQTCQISKYRSLKFPWDSHYSILNCSLV